MSYESNKYNNSFDAIVAAFKAGIVPFAIFVAVIILVLK